MFLQNILCLQQLCIFTQFFSCHIEKSAIAEFYLYPTVTTALIYLLKPELNKWDQIEYGVRSNWVILRCMAIIRRIVAYKIIINK